MLLALMPVMAVALVFPGSLGRWLNPGPRLARRMGLAPPVRWTTAAAATFAAAGACLCVYAQGSTAIPPWAIPAALVSASGLAAAGTVLAGGMKLPAAAMYADRRCRLSERLSTALELKERGDTGPFAVAVQAQAIGAWHRRGGRRLRYWRRSRVTAGVLGLTILSCLVLLLIPPRADPRLLAEQQLADSLTQAAAQADASAGQIGLRAAETHSAILKEQANRMRRLAEDVRAGKKTPEEAMAEVNRMQDKLRASRARQAELAVLMESQLRRMTSGDLTAAERATVSERLRAMAAAAKDNPALAARLTDAAKALDDNDLARLKAALAAIGQAADDAGLAGNDEAVNETMNDLERLKQTLAKAAGDATAARARVRVSPPGEGPPSIPAAPNEGAAATSAPASPPPSTATAAETAEARAWAAARERAEAVQYRQRIPARLRKLVRDYYAAGQ